MSESTKKIYYYNNGIYSITTYTDIADVGTPHIVFNVDGTNYYAKLGDVADPLASHLRAQCDVQGVSTTKAILVSSQQSGDVFWTFGTGTAGSGDTQLNYPLGVDVDSSGNVFVADNNNRRLVKITGSGSLVWQTGAGAYDPTYPASLFVNLPKDVAIDSNGDCFVVEYSNHRLAKFTTSGGTYSRVWMLPTTSPASGTGDGQFTNPISVDTDSSGNAIVADYLNHRIQKISSSGTFIWKLGSYGTGDGQFYRPMWITVDPSDDIIVADNYNNRIQKISSSGIFMWKLGGTTAGTGNGQFNKPRGTAVDSSGNIIVADTGNNRIQKISSSGTWTWTLGGGGTASNGDFYQPYAVAVDPSNGYIYVADTNNNRIQKITPDGQWVWTVGGFNQPQYLVVDGSSNVFVSDYGNHRIQKIMG